MKYRKVKRLSTTDAAYLAGLVDGEGTITLSASKDRTRKPSLSIANTDRGLLEWTREVTGSGFISTKRSKKEPHHLDAHIWASYSDQALNIVEQILPYLKEAKKLARAKFLLDNYKKVTPRNGKYTKELFKKKEEFVKEFYCLSNKFTRSIPIEDLPPFS